MITIIEFNPRRKTVFETAIDPDLVIGCIAVHECRYCVGIAFTHVPTGRMCFLVKVDTDSAIILDIATALSLMLAHVEAERSRDMAPLFSLDDPLTKRAQELWNEYREFTLPMRSAHRESQS